MKIRISVVFICISLFSCTLSTPHVSNYPLSNEIFYSSTGEFWGQIPIDWIAHPLDTNQSMYKVRLSKNDYSATCYIQELYIDLKTKKEIEENGLILLAQISFALNNENETSTGVDAKPTEFEINGKVFCSYEIRENNEVRKVIIFSNGGAYYECVAKPNKDKMTKEELDNLFAAQRAMLTSLTFK